jgi:HK97 family phage major capsid protein
MYAQWAEQEGPEGAPTAVAEGAAKPQIDFNWVEKSAKVEKIAAFIKVSKEMLSDLAGLRNEIDTELQETVLLKTDDDLWDANGTTPNIKGITAWATAFSMPAGLSADVDNKADLLRAAIAQVEANKFVANYIVMHPTDIAAMDIDKDGEGRYLLPPFRSSNGLAISGIPIVANLGVDQDKFLVGDFTKWHVRIREGFNIDVGLDGNDFTNNLVTILGEIRLVSYVKTNHAGAFVYGDFSNVLGS